MKNFPYKYYFYGSQDSLDIDVLIQISQEEMPNEQEDRKRFLKAIEIEYDLNWNTNLIVVDDGVIVDTIYPKAWVDSLNNAFFNTYDLHHQVYENPIFHTVKRNKLLAIYKAVRTVLAVNSRTDKRPLIRPYLNGIHDFNLKLKSLDCIDLRSILTFSQKNTQDVDIWKTIAFYIGQNLLLIQRNIEVYSKRDVLKFYPKLRVFIDRESVSSDDLAYLQDLFCEWKSIIGDYGQYISISENLSCNGEVIDMKNEKY